MSFRLRARSIIPAAAVILSLAVPLAAQYYGRNKVQYEKFDFKVMKTRHFDIYFYLEDRETVKQAGLMAERWYSRLSRMFNHELKGRQPLVLYSSGPEFQQTTVIPGTMGEGTGGVTESFKRRIILPYGPSLSETDHVIGHELVHAFQYDIMAQGHSDNQRGAGDALRIPLWFIEGMAEYLSIGPVDPNTSMWMRDTVRRKDLPQISKLDNSYKYFPYRYGHSLWSYVTGKLGDEVIGKMMKNVGRQGSYESVLEVSLGTKLKQISADWHKSMQDAYASLNDKTQMPDKAAKPVVLGSEDNVYNISPSLSPDGKEMIFLSTRDLFSIDLFLADAMTGKVKRKIISTAVDPHFESIQFIRSAGSWDAKGELFVFGAVAKGRPLLTVVNVPKNRIEKEIPFPELGEILSPCWSPDGTAIAFSALAGGVSDIFIYDLKTSTVKQMTRDSFGDLEPAWSPDGTRIAFVTERFSTNLEWLDIGNCELALLDPETARVEKVLAFPAGKNINPQWTPDSKSLFFVSDQSGKSDLYRIELETGKIRQVTNLYAGISGITELSPAISVAQENGRVAFSGYDQGRYSIYAIDDPETLAGQAFLAQFDTNLAVMPPRKQAEGSLLGLLKNPLFGLPKDTNFMVSGYKPKLSLDYLTPPTVGIGVDRYGTYGAGGIAAYWSDMLGYHTVMTMAQTSNRLIDTDIVLAYQNSRRRANWGAVLQRISYPYPFYTISTGTVFGEPAYIEEENIYRQINYDFSAFGFYPLSQVQRLEFSGGYRLLDFNWTVYTRAYSLLDNALLLYEKSTLPTGKSLSFGYLSAAYIYDTGIFGATSPILGRTDAVQISPAVGSLTYYNILGDFRRYYMPVRPFTLAFRALHYGRYGKDAEDGRMFPMYIGYWDLIRGYESFNFGSQEELSEFDINRLYGSKMIIANAEIRFPLFRALGIGKGYYGPFPIEAFAFYDWGLAWDSIDKAYFLSGGTRKPVTSAGFGLRTNLFGYLVIGVHYVYPFQRPLKGWHFQLSLSPGF